MSPQANQNWRENPSWPQEFSHHFGEFNFSISGDFFLPFRGAISLSFLLLLEPYVASPFCVTMVNSGIGRFYGKTLALKIDLI